MLNHINIYLVLSFSFLIASYNYNNTFNTVHKNLSNTMDHLEYESLKKDIIRSRHYAIKSSLYAGISIGITISTILMFQYLKF